jgi:hypothetical protein
MGVAVGAAIALIALVLLPDPSLCAVAAIQRYYKAACWGLLIAARSARA